MGNLDTMNAHQLLTKADVFYSLVKQAGLVNDYVGPVLRKPDPNSQEKLNIGQQLEKTINGILQNAAKEEPYPSGWIQANELSLTGSNSGKAGEGWSFRTEIIWKNNSLLQDPVVGAAIGNEIYKFVAKVNDIAKAEFDRLAPKPGSVSENIYYNYGGADFLDIGME